MELKELSNGMNAIGTELKDAYIILNKKFEDERGFFMEAFNLDQFKKIVGYDIEFVQDNHSKSSKGVLRKLFPSRYRKRDIYSHPRDKISRNNKLQRSNNFRV